MVAQSTTTALTLGAERTRLRSVRCFCISGIYGMCFPQLIAGFHDANVKGVPSQPAVRFCQGYVRSASVAGILGLKHTCKKT
jgi:hypothetical protein